MPNDLKQVEEGIFSFQKQHNNMSKSVATQSTLSTAYHIAENFQGRKLSPIGKKIQFSLRKLFHRLLAFATPKYAMPPNFAEKTFTNSHKSTKFTKVFERFPLYGIYTATRSTKFTIRNN